MSDVPDTGPPGHDEGCPPAGEQPSESNLNLASTVAHEPPPFPSVADLAALYPLPVSTSCVGCDNGTELEDGRRRCWRHLTPEDHAALDELNRRGRAVGVPPDRHHLLEGQRDWPYGARASVAMRRRMLAWAEANQLRYAERSHACAAWLIGSRCPGVRRCAGLGPAILRVLDHASSWTGPSGLRLVIAQPYAVGPDDAPELRAWTDTDGLHLRVLPPGSCWYGPETHAVILAGFPSTQEAAA